MTQIQRHYQSGHREAAVEMVFESREPDESLKLVCTRLAPVLDVKFATLYNWAKRATPGVDAAFPTFSKVMGPLLRTAEQGGDTLVWLAGGDTALESNGRFWLDRRPRNTHKLRSTRNSDTADRREQIWNWVSETSGCHPAAPAPTGSS